jgi:hypothetical protein
LHDPREACVLRRARERIIAMSNRGFPKASVLFLLVVLALAARPAAGEPLVLTSDFSGPGSTSYSRYLGADRGLASGGQNQEQRGLKDVFEACVRCDAGEGLDLQKSLGGIGMFGRWHGSGYSFGGSQKPLGGSQGSGGGWSAPQATGPIVASIAARGGLGDVDLDREQIAFLLGLFKQWWERGLNGGLPGRSIFGNGGGSQNSPTPTPEPATLALVAGGLAAAAAIRRRQQRRASHL